jgi:hypothetical protein
MKLFVTLCGVAWLLAYSAAAQEPLHLAVAPVNALRPVLMSAISIERGVDYPSAIELKGRVEVRIPVCIATSKSATKKTHVCDGETVLHADEATFHEDSGRVEARGNVTVTPVHYGQKR